MNDTGVFGSRIELREHPVAGYPARTRYNAAAADLTIAFAVDFESAGERLTRRVAAERYVAVDVLEDVARAGLTVSAAIQKWNAGVLNVAGNSLKTLVEHGWTQVAMNEFVFKVLRDVCQNSRISMVISGGQTGADIAGIVAATALDIPTVVTFPRGFVQRDERGKDFKSDPAKIRQDIARWASNVARAQEMSDECEVIGDVRSVER